MKQKANKVLAILLSVLMLASIVPSTVLAAIDWDINSTASTDNYYTIISKNDWAIAPGINETEVVLNNKSGDRRQVIHLMEADISNPYTRVISSYTNMDTSNYAISTIPDHAKFIEEQWGENVVGAMNTCLSWYNSAAYAQDPSRVNEPLGFMMVDGEVYFDHSVGFPTCIVIHKDTNDKGETRPTTIPKVEMRTVTSTANLNGWEDQVIPCSSGYIVKDGVNQQKPSHGTDTAARSVVGVKADGSIVIMMNDGRQPTLSVGMNMYECAEVMIAAGCVYASNCDGGGSSTFMSQRPGEELTVNCSPCDGALRQNTHGIMFISTAPSTGEFDNAYLTTESDYYVPYSKVNVEAIGRDFSGAEAEIPAEATWALADASFGTVANGVFVSNGKLGDVEIQMNYNGKVVGTKTIHVVNPESASFAQSSTIIPYGKSTGLDIAAKYGVFDVVYTEDAFEWTISDATAGTRDGLKYIAGNDTSKTGVVITATYKYADLGTTTLNIGFGKGSEVVWDFEDGDVSNWLGIDDVREWLKENNIKECDNLFQGGNFSDDNDSETFLSSVANGGKVHSGEYALGVELDFTHSSFSEWSYNMFFNVEGQTVLRDVANGKNATRFGMWVYIPEELWEGKDLSSIAAQTQFYAGTSAETATSFQSHLTLSTSSKRLNALKDEDIPEDRWVYCYIDLTGYNYVSLQNPEKQTWREPCFMRFYTQHYTPKNLIFYFDDMTLDYSNAVDDRDAPIISNLTVNVSGTNYRSFNATIADFVANNTSGLDYASAKILVDGLELPDVVASGSAISSKDVYLAGGAHTVSFIIKDNMGNTMKKSMNFTVEGTASVTLGGHNATNSAPEYDSVYYVDINAANVAEIEEVTTTIKLSTAHTWEAAYMDVAAGFKAKYSVNYYDNTVTVTLTKTSDCTLTGAQTLASIPVRVWSWNEESGVTEEEQFASGLGPIVSIDVKTIVGSIKYADGYKDGYIGTFNSSMLVATNIDDVKVLWHDHVAGEAQNKDATCTEDGYIGRVYCVGCNCVKYKEGATCEHHADGCGSVVDWGTTLPATGHEYTVIDGKLACECGELFNGVYTDGKTYIDGVIADGWVDDTYYYANGKMVTGSIVIDKVVYTFDENGVYLENNVFNGFIETEEGLMYFYANANYEKEYVYINDTAYYFTNGIAKTGEYIINGEKCIFEDGVYKSCSTANILSAGWEGTNVTYILYTDGSLVLGGEGATYKYTSRVSIPWGNYKTQVKTILIKKDVTVLDQFALAETYYAKTITFEEGSKLNTIGAAAFLSNYGITEIVLPESLERLNQNAFKMCKNLVNVVIPQNIKYISFHAFVNNSNKIMENISLSVVEGTVGHEFAVKYNVPFTFYTVPRKVVDSGVCGENATWTLYNDGVLEIGGSGAMTNLASTAAQPWEDYVKQIKAVVIGKDITSIGNYSFAYCYYIESITFEEGSKLENVGAVAFHYDYSIKEVILPETVKTIGHMAFAYSSKLVNVYIPQDATSIAAGAFTNSKNVVLNVAKDTYSERFAINNGIAHTTREYIFIPMASGTCGENVTWELFGNGTLNINGSGAMADYPTAETPWKEYSKLIKNVVIGKDITAIGYYAFAYCQAIETVTFEEGSKLEKIGAVAFHYALNLKSVTLPDSVTYIGTLAFGYSSRLTYVYIPQEIKTIVNGAFTNSKNVVLDVTEGTLGETFAQNNNISYTTRKYVYEVIASGTCGENATWELLNNGQLTISGSGAIANFASANAQPWAAYASKIKSVVIGKDITAIGNYAFAYCYYIESVTFEEYSALETVGVAAFHYAMRLKTVTLPSTVTYVGNLAFGYSSQLTTVVIPAGATVHANAFYKSPNVNVA